MFMIIYGFIITFISYLIAKPLNKKIPQIPLIVFAICYAIGSFVMDNLGLKESILYMIEGIGDFEIAIALIVLSLLVWFISYIYSMRVMKKKEF